MRNISIIDWIAYILVVIGGINCGLIGFFSWDLIAAIFGDMSSVSRIIYALIGLAGLYVLVKLFSDCNASMPSEEV